MRAVLQRVTRASVTVDGEVLGKIGKGFMILLGVENSDTEEITDKMADKICKLRIFEDENGKTNLSLADVGGELLVISQFTLYADCKKGNRPSFVKAGAPDMAERLYEHFMDRAVYLKSCSLSNISVNGTSFNSSTFISAPNCPFSTTST